MRKVFLFFTVAVLALLLMGAATALGVHSALDALNGATVTIDGETFSGTTLAGAVGGGVVAAIVVGVVVIGILASVAIFLPIVLLVVAAIVLFSLVMGLAPILVPVLLLVGAYVLLSRWAKRRAAADATRLPSPSSPTN